MFNEEEFFKRIIEKKEQRRALPLKDKFSYLIYDFKIDWSCRKYYKKTWILKHINFIRIIIFLLPHHKKNFH